MACLYKSAEISNFAPKELKEYRKDMTTERDIKNQMAFAHDKGKSEGREEGKIEALHNTARNLLKIGMSPDNVSEATGLSVEEIMAL